MRGAPAVAAVPDDELKDVEVGLALSPALHLEPAPALQLLDGAGDGGLGCAKILGHALLAGKDHVIGPGVGEQHAVDDLSIGRDRGILQQEIGDLRKATSRDRVKPLQDDVLLLLKARDVHQFLHTIFSIHARVGFVCCLALALDTLLSMC